MVNQGAFEGPQGSGWPAGCRPRGWEGSLSYRLPDATRTQPEILNPLGCWTDVVMFLIKKFPTRDKSQKPRKRKQSYPNRKKKTKMHLHHSKIFFAFGDGNPATYASSIIHRVGKANIIIVVKNTHLLFFIRLIVTISPAHLPNVHPDCGRNALTVAAYAHGPGLIGRTRPGIVQNCPKLS